MMDEFDEFGADLQQAPPPRPLRDAAARQRASVARLISRAYRSAGGPLRSRVLAHLLRPLGTLSLVAVASGAFGRVLLGQGPAIDALAVDETSRYADGKILELARFVQDVDPATLQQVIALLADNPLSGAALTAAAIVLLSRRMHRGGEVPALRNDSDGVTTSR